MADLENTSSPEWIHQEKKEKTAIQPQLHGVWGLEVSNSRQISELQVGKIKIQKPCPTPKTTELVFKTLIIYLETEWTSKLKTAQCK